MTAGDALDAVFYAGGEIPHIKADRRSGDGMVRSLQVRLAEPYVIDNGADPVITCHLDGGRYLDWRAGHRAHSDAATVGRTFVVEPGARIHTFGRGRIGRILQIKVSDRLMVESFLEDHDEPRGLEALRLPAGEVDLQLLRLMSGLLVAEGDLRELALRELIGHLSRRYALRATRHRRRGIPPARLKRVHDLVEGDLADVSLKTMAAEAGLSLYHFAREYRYATGKTPWEYVMQRRVATAIQMICKGRSLSHIYSAVGFSNMSHMAQIFRQQLGASPGVVRASLIL